MWMSTSEQAKRVRGPMTGQTWEADDEEEAQDFKMEQLVGCCTGSRLCCGSSKASASQQPPSVTPDVVRGLIDAFQTLGLAAFQPGQEATDPQNLLAELRLLRFIATTSNACPTAAAGAAKRNKQLNGSPSTATAATDGTTASSSSSAMSTGSLLLSRAPLLRFLHDMESMLTPGTTGALLEGREEGKTEEPGDDGTTAATTIVGAWPSGELMLLRHDPYPAPRRRALLIAESAADALRLAERARGDGFAVEVARTALSGLALIAVRAFDVVVSGIAFPMVNGIEMVRRLRHFENDGEFHRRRGGVGARSAFVVLVRNGVGTATAVQARALRGGADHFVERFDDVRFSSLHHLLDEVACEPSPPSMVVSTRQPAEAVPIPSPLFRPLPMQLPTLTTTPMNSGSTIDTTSSSSDAMPEPTATSSELHVSLAESAITTIITTAAPPQATTTTKSCGGQKRKASQAAAAAAAASGADAPKIRRACAYCHTKKVSCSCTRPCNRCMELDLPCTDYEPRLRSKRQRSSRPPAPPASNNNNKHRHPPMMPQHEQPQHHHHHPAPQLSYIPDPLPLTTATPIIRSTNASPTQMVPPQPPMPTTSAVLVPPTTDTYTFQTQTIGLPPAPPQPSRSSSPQQQQASPASRPLPHLQHAMAAQSAMVYSTSTMTDYQRLPPRPTPLIPAPATLIQPALYILQQHEQPLDALPPPMLPTTTSGGGGLFRTASEQNFFTSLQAARRQSQQQQWVSAQQACGSNGYMVIQQQQPRLPPQQPEPFATVFDEQVFM